MVLHHMKGIKQNPRFKDLCHQTTYIAKQCIKLLHKPIVEATALNVEQLELNFQYAFAEYLPKFAELIIKEENVDESKYGSHQAVINVLQEYHQQIFPTF